jgi:hypothetical protein
MVTAFLFQQHLVHSTARVTSLVKAQKPSLSKEQMFWKRRDLESRRSAQFPPRSCSSSRRQVFLLLLT